MNKKQISLKNSFLKNRSCSVPIDNTKENINIRFKENVEAIEHLPKNLTIFHVGAHADDVSWIAEYLYHNRDINHVISTVFSFDYLGVRIEDLKGIIIESVCNHGKLVEMSPKIFRQYAITQRYNEYIYAVMRIIKIRTDINGEFKRSYENTLGFCLSLKRLFLIKVEKYIRIYLNLMI